jgi:hypothetical protein
VSELRTYTAEEREAALAVYAEEGAGEASRQTGIPRGTISCWAFKAGIKPVDPAKNAALLAQRQAELAQWRQDIADKLYVAAERFVRETEEAEATTTDKKNLITAAAIAIDKAQLLTGAATGRVEHAATDDGAEWVARKRDDLAERRQAKAS